MEQGDTGATGGAPTSKTKETGTRVQYITHYFSLGHANYRLAVLESSQQPGIPKLEDLGITAVPPGEEIWFVDTRLPVEREESTIWKWALTDAEAAKEETLPKRKLKANRIRTMDSEWKDGQVLAVSREQNQTESTQPVALIGLVGEDEELSEPEELAIIHSAMAVAQAATKAALANVTVQVSDEDIMARRRRGKSPGTAVEEMVDRQGFASDVAKRVVMLAQRQVSMDEEELEKHQGDIAKTSNLDTRRTSIKTFEHLVGDRDITKQALNLTKLEMVTVSLSSDGVGEVAHDSTTDVVEGDEQAKGEIPSVLLDEMVNRELFAAGIAKNVIKLAQIQVYADETGTTLTVDTNKRPVEELNEQEESVIQDISNGVRTLKRRKRAKGVEFDMSNWDKNGNLSTLSDDARAGKPIKEERTIILPTVDNRYMKSRGIDINEQSVELKFLPSYKELTPESDYSGDYDSVPMEIETRAEMTSSRRKSLVDAIPDSVQYHIYRRMSLQDPTFSTTLREMRESVSSDADSDNKDEIDRIIDILPRIELRRIHCKYIHTQDQVVPILKPVHSHTLRFDGTYNEDEDMETEDAGSIDEEKADEIARLVYNLCRRYSLHEVDDLQLYKRMSIIPGASPLCMEITPDMACFTAHPDSEEDEFARPEQEESSVSMILEPAPTVTIPSQYIETQFDDSESRYRKFLIDAEQAEVAAEAGITLQGEFEYKTTDPGTEEEAMMCQQTDTLMLQSDSTLPDLEGDVLRQKIQYSAVSPGEGDETTISQQTDTLTFQSDSALPDSEGDVLRQKIQYSAVSPGEGDETTISQQTDTLPFHSDSALPISEGDILKQKIQYSAVHSGEGDETTISQQTDTLPFHSDSALPDSEGDILKQKIQYSAVHPGEGDEATIGQQTDTLTFQSDSALPESEGDILKQKLQYSAVHPGEGDEATIGLQTHTLMFHSDSTLPDSTGNILKQKMQYSAVSQRDGDQAVIGQQTEILLLQSDCAPLESEGDVLKQNIKLSSVCPGEGDQAIIGQQTTTLLLQSDSTQPESEGDVIKQNIQYSAVSPGESDQVVIDQQKESLFLQSDSPSHSALSECDGDPLKQTIQFSTVSPREGHDTIIGLQTESLLLQSDSHVLESEGDHLTEKMQLSAVSPGKGDDQQAETIDVLPSNRTLPEMEGDPLKETMQLSAVSPGESDEAIIGVQTEEFVLPSDLDVSDLEGDILKQNVHVSTVRPMDQDENILNQNTDTSPNSFEGAQAVSEGDPMKCQQTYETIEVDFDDNRGDVVVLDLIKCELDTKQPDTWSEELPHLVPGKPHDEKVLNKPHTETIPLSFEGAEAVTEGDPQQCQQSYETMEADFDDNRGDVVVLDLIKCEMDTKQPDTLIEELPHQVPGKPHDEKVLNQPTETILDGFEGTQAVSEDDPLQCQQSYEKIEVDIDDNRGDVVVLDLIKCELDNIQPDTLCEELPHQVPGKPHDDHELSPAKSEDDFVWVNDNNEKVDSEQQHVRAIHSSSGSPVDTDFVMVSSTDQPEKESPQPQELSDELKVGEAEIALSKSSMREGSLYDEALLDDQADCSKDLILQGRSNECMPGSEPTTGMIEVSDPHSLALAIGQQKVVDTNANHKDDSNDIDNDSVHEEDIEFIEAKETTPVLSSESSIDFEFEDAPESAMDLSVIHEKDDEEPIEQTSSTNISEIPHDYQEKEPETSAFVVCPAAAIETRRPEVDSLELTHDEERSLEDVGPPRKKLATDDLLGQTNVIEGVAEPDLQQAVSETNFKQQRPASDNVIYIPSQATTDFLSSELDQAIQYGDNLSQTANLQHGKNDIDMKANLDADTNIPVQTPAADIESLPTDDMLDLDSIQLSQTSVRNDEMRTTPIESDMVTAQHSAGQITDLDEEQDLAEQVPEDDKLLQTPGDPFIPVKIQKPGDGSSLQTEQPTLTTDLDADETPPDFDIQCQNKDVFDGSDAPTKPAAKLVTDLDANTADDEPGIPLTADLDKDSDTEIGEQLPAEQSTIKDPGVHTLNLIPQDLSKSFGETQTPAKPHRIVTDLDADDSDEDIAKVEGQLLNKLQKDQQLGTNVKEVTDLDEDEASQEKSKPLADLTTDLDADSSDDDYALPTELEVQPYQDPDNQQLSRSLEVQQLSSEDLVQDPNAVGTILEIRTAKIGPETEYHTSEESTVIPGGEMVTVATTTTVTEATSASITYEGDNISSNLAIEMPFLEEEPLQQTEAIQEKSCDPDISDDSLSPDDALPSPFIEAMKGDPFSSALTTIFFRTHYTDPLEGESVAVVWDSDDSKETLPSRSCMGQEIPPESGYWYMFCRLPASVQVKWKLVLKNNQSGALIRCEERSCRKMVVPSVNTLVDALWGFDDTHIDVHDYNEQLEAIPFAFDVECESSETSEEGYELKPIPEEKEEPEFDIQGVDATYESIEEYSESLEEDIMEDAKFLAEQLGQYNPNVSDVPERLEEDVDVTENQKSLASDQVHVEEEEVGNKVEDQGITQDVKQSEGALVPYMTDVFIRTHNMVHTADEYVAVIGDSEYLGNWNVHTSIGEELPKGSGFWYVYCKMPAGLKVKWKLIVFDRRKGHFLRFEERPNRTVTIPSYPIMIDVLWGSGQTAIEVHPNEKPLESIPFSYVVDIPEAYRDRRTAVLGNALNMPVLALKYDTLQVALDDDTVPENLAALAKEVLSDDMVIENNEDDKDSTTVLPDRRVSFIHDKPFEIQLAVAPYMSDVFIRTHYLVHSDDEYVAVIGDSDYLGKWKIHTSIGEELPKGSGFWYVYCKLPAGLKIHWKLIVFNRRDGFFLRFEERPNRTLTIPSHSIMVDALWAYGQTPIDVNPNETELEAIPFSYTVDVPEEYRSRRAGLFGDPSSPAIALKYDSLKVLHDEGSIPENLTALAKEVLSDEPNQNAIKATPQDGILEEKVSISERRVSVIHTVPFDCERQVDAILDEEACVTMETGETDQTGMIEPDIDLRETVSKYESIAAFSESLEDSIIADAKLLIQGLIEKPSHTGAEAVQDIQEEIEFEQQLIEESAPQLWVENEDDIQSAPDSVDLYPANYGALVPYKTDFFFRTHHLANSSNEHVAVIGDSEYLGNWKVHTRIGEELPKGSGFWYIYCKLPAGLKINWKLIVFDKEQGRFLYFEERPNRKLVVPSHPIMVDALWGYGQTPIEVHPDERQLEEIPFSYVVDVPDDYRDRRTAFFGEALNIPAIALKHESLRVSHEDEKISAALAKEVLTDEASMEDETPDVQNADQQVPTPDRPVTLTHEAPFEIQGALVPYETDVFFRTHHLVESEDEHVAVIGDSEFLGNRNVHTSIGEELPKGSGFWYIYCRLPAGLKINWKLIVFDKGQGLFLRFEERPNRKLVIPCHPLLVDARWGYGQTPIEVDPDEKELEGIPFSYIDSVPDSYKGKRGEVDNKAPAIALKYESLRVTHDANDIPGNLYALAKEVLQDEFERDESYIEIETEPMPVSHRRVSLIHDVPFEIAGALVPYTTDVFFRTHYLPHSDDEHIAVIGDCEHLGNWKVHTSIGEELPKGSCFWYVYCKLPAGLKINWKLIVFDKRQGIFLRVEERPNRKLTIPSHPIMVDALWGYGQTPINVHPEEKELESIPFSYVVDVPDAYRKRRQDLYADDPQNAAIALKYESLQLASVDDDVPEHLTAIAKEVLSTEVESKPTDTNLEESIPAGSTAVPERHVSLVPEMQVKVEEESNLETSNATYEIAFESPQSRQSDEKRAVVVVPEEVQPCIQSSKSSIIDPVANIIISTQEPHESVAANRSDTVPFEQEITFETPDDAIQQVAETPDVDHHQGIEYRAAVSHEVSIVEKSSVDYSATDLTPQDPLKTIYISRQDDTQLEEPETVTESKNTQAVPKPKEYRVLEATTPGVQEHMQSFEESAGSGLQLTIKPIDVIEEQKPCVSPTTETPVIAEGLEPIALSTELVTGITQVVELQSAETSEGVISIDPETSEKAGILIIDETQRKMSTSEQRPLVAVDLQQERDQVLVESVAIEETQSEEKGVPFSVHLHSNHNVATSELTIMSEQVAEGMLTTSEMEMEISEAAEIAAIHETAVTENTNLIEGILPMDDSKSISVEIKSEEGPEKALGISARPDTEIDVIDEILQPSEVTDISETHPDQATPTMDSYHEVAIQESAFPVEVVQSCDKGEIEDMVDVPNVTLLTTEVEVIVGAEEVGKINFEHATNVQENKPADLERKVSVTAPMYTMEVDQVSHEVTEMEITPIGAPEMKTINFEIENVGDQSVALSEKTIETEEAVPIEMEPAFDVPEVESTEPVKETFSITAPRPVTEIDPIIYQESEVEVSLMESAEIRDVSYETAPIVGHVVALAERAIGVEEASEFEFENVMNITDDEPIPQFEMVTSPRQLSTIDPVSHDVTEIEVATIVAPEPKDIPFDSEPLEDHVVALSEKSFSVEETVQLEPEPESEFNIPEHEQVPKMEGDVSSTLPRPLTTIDPVVHDVTEIEASPITELQTRDIPVGTEPLMEQVVALTEEKSVDPEVANIVEPEHVFKVSGKEQDPGTERKVSTSVPKPLMETDLLSHDEQEVEATTIGELKTNLVDYQTIAPAQHSVVLQESLLPSEEISGELERSKDKEITPAVEVQITEREAAVVMRTKAAEEAPDLQAETTLQITTVIEEPTTTSVEVIGSLVRPPTEIQAVFTDTPEEEATADLTGGLKMEEVYINIQPTGEHVVILQEEINIPEQSSESVLVEALYDSKQETVIGIENTALNVKNVTVLEKASVIHVELTESAPESTVEIVAQPMTSKTERPISLTELQLECPVQSSTMDICITPVQKASQGDIGNQQQTITTEIAMPLETVKESSQDIESTRAEMEVEGTEGQLTAVTQRTIPEEDVEVHSPDVDSIALISDIATIEMQQTPPKQTAVIEKRIVTENASNLPDHIEEGSASQLNTIIRTYMSGLDPDNRLGVTGDLPELGNWKTIKHFAVENPPGSGLWYIHLTLPRGVSFWWKLVQGSPDGSEIRQREDHEDRRYIVPKTGDSLIDVLWASEEKVISLSDVTTEMTEIPFAYGEVRIKTDKGIVGVKKVDGLINGAEPNDDTTVPGFEYKLPKDKDDINVNVKVDVTQPLPTGDNGSETSMETAHEDFEDAGSERKDSNGSVTKEDTTLEFDKDLTAEVRERELLWVLKSESEIQVCIGPRRGGEREELTSVQLTQNIELEGAAGQITNGAAGPHEMSTGLRNLGPGIPSSLVQERTEIKTWFRTHRFVGEGLSIGVTGSLPELGSWDPSSAVLGVEHPVGSGFWYINSNIRVGEVFQWKLAVIDTITNVTKEEEVRERREHNIPSRPVLIDTIWSGIDRVNLVEDVADVSEIRNILPLSQDNNLYSESLRHIDDQLSKVEKKENNLMIGPIGRTKDKTTTSIQQTPAYSDFKRGIHVSSSEKDFETDQDYESSSLDDDSLCKEAETKLNRLIEEFTLRQHASDPGLEIQGRDGQQSTARYRFHSQPILDTSCPQSLILSITTERSSDNTISKSMEVCFIDYDNSTTSSPSVSLSYDDVDYWGSSDADTDIIEYDSDVSTPLQCSPREATAINEDTTNNHRLTFPEENEHVCSSLSERSLTAVFDADGRFLSCTESDIYDSEDDVCFVSYAGRNKNVFVENGKVSSCPNHRGCNSEFSKTAANRPRNLMNGSMQCSNPIDAMGIHVSGSSSEELDNVFYDVGLPSNSPQPPALPPKRATTNSLSKDDASFISNGDIQNLQRIERNDQGRELEVHELTHSNGEDEVVFITYDGLTEDPESKSPIPSNISREDALTAPKTLSYTHGSSVIFITYDDTHEKQSSIESIHSEPSLSGSTADKNNNFDNSEVCFITYGSDYQSIPKVQTSKDSATKEDNEVRFINFGRETPETLDNHEKIKVKDGRSRSDYNYAYDNDFNNLKNATQNKIGGVHDVSDTRKMENLNKSEVCFITYDGQTSVSLPTSKRKEATQTSLSRTANQEERLSSMNFDTPAAVYLRSTHLHDTDRIQETLKASIVPEFVDSRVNSLRLPRVEVVHLF